MWLVPAAMLSINNFEPLKKSFLIRLIYLNVWHSNVRINSRSQHQSTCNENINREGSVGLHIAGRSHVGSPHVRPSWAKWEKSFVNQTAQLKKKNGIVPTEIFASPMNLYMNRIGGAESETNPNQTYKQSNNWTPNTICITRIPDSSRS